MVGRDADRGAGLEARRGGQAGVKRRWLPRLAIMAEGAGQGSHRIAGRGPYALPLRGALGGV